MANAAHNLSPAEIEERKLWLQRLSADFPKASAEVIPMRRPLGLSIITDDDPASGPPPDNMNEDDSVVLHDGFRFSFKDDSTAEQLDAPATVDLVYTMGNALISTNDTTHQRAKEMVAAVRSEFARVELENAKLRASVRELTAKVESLTFISERMRIENAGPAGPRGLMGRDGAEGRPGERGERGANGRAGAPGPRIIGWTLDEQAFTATPLLSDGRKGAVLHLMPLFQAYNEQVEAADAAEEHDAAQAQRAVVEREAEAVREGRPAR